MYEYRIKIVRVVDGDTVDCDIDVGFGMWLRTTKKRPLRIRLLGLDTPETKTRDAREKKFGRLAAARMNELAPVGSEALLKSRELDNFGRILGNVWPWREAWGSDPEGKPLGPTVSETMIEERLGVPYFGGDKARIKAAHETNWDYLEAQGH